jgi:hypothetical protein
VSQGHHTAIPRARNVGPISGSSGSHLTHCLCYWKAMAARLPTFDKRPGQPRSPQRAASHSSAYGLKWIPGPSTPTNSARAKIAASIQATLRLIGPAGGRMGPIPALGGNGPSESGQRPPQLQAARQHIGRFHRPRESSGSCFHLCQSKKSSKSPASRPLPKSPGRCPKPRGIHRQLGKLGLPELQV